MKTCCVQNEAAVQYIANETIPSSLQTPCSASRPGKRGPAEEQGRVPEVFLCHSPRFWEMLGMLSPAGAAEGTVLSAPWPCCV